MNSITLRLNQAAFDRLHEVSDSRRTMVKVSRDDLAVLLMDYSEMLVTLKRNSGMCKVIEPESPRERRRLK